MKSEAPSLIPRTASSTDAQAVMRITGISGFSSLIFLNISIPSSPLIDMEKFMSSNTRSNSISLIYLMISSGPNAKLGVYPAFASK